MSQRYKGGVISATPPTVSATSPNAYGTAKGVWTLQQQFQYEGAGTWPSPFAPVYIEDVFSTYLYTGNNSTQTITNGIDLSGEGGLVWTKVRSTIDDHELIDTVRGRAFSVESNTTDAQSTSSVGTSLTQFNSNGYSLGTNGSANVNENAQTFVSWTFRKAEKFFDVVTWTGNGASERAINHNLGSVPGFVVVKCTSTSGDWWVAARNNSGTYHRSDNSSGTGRLNTTGPLSSALNLAGLGYLTSTTFIPQGVTGGVLSESNTNGATYVAYLFAHDAGGFGDSGSDNVISCGSFTTDLGGVATAPINLGYEPQWVMIKQSSGGGSDWRISDVMRGASQTNSVSLWANLSDAEYNYSGTQIVTPTATGFNAQSLNGLETYIYIAIRRGPMKTPEAGTEVFEPLARSGTGAAATITTTVRPDGVLQNWRSGGLGSASHFFYDRLRGVAKALFTDTADAESTQTATGINAFNNLSYGIAGAGSMNNGSATYVDYIFTRAPGFFDEVCYTGTGSATTQTHNLGVTPELMIVRGRSAGTSGSNWSCYHSALGNTQVISLNEGIQAYTSTQWNNTTPTASVFSIGTQTNVNGSGQTYVAYLFASVAGVSKVGSYTGTATTQQINCGFTGGARFVLIKRTDSAGDWYVWDSARGIVAGNDPYLLLNSTAAEVTNTDYVDTYSAGFEISSTAPAAINANGGTYIFLAIA